MVIMRILKHIYLDKSFLFFLFIIILTGSFNDFFFYFLLLFIHEMGHTMMGLIYGYSLDKISFYPYGGITTFNLPINIPLKKELWILLMGPIMQIIGYLIIKNYYFKIEYYHYALLFFNLLPIYPLDGGKIANVVLGFFFAYYKCFKIILIISLITIFISFMYFTLHFNLNVLLTLSVIFVKLVKYYNKRYYYYNRFLLERHLYNQSFAKIAFIKNKYSFFRDNYHFVNFTDEKKYLMKFFQK